MTSVTPSPSIPFSSLTPLGCLSASALLLALILNNLTRGKMYQCKLCNTVCWDHIYSRFCSRNRELTDVEAHTSVIAHCLISILPTLYLMEKIWKKISSISHFLSFCQNTWFVHLWDRLRSLIKSISFCQEKMCFLLSSQWGKGEPLAPVSQWLK